MAKKAKSPTPTKFQVGDRVRVKQGIRDADYEPGHPTVYSFHLNDAFQFQRNVRVVEEQMAYGPGEKVIRERHPLWTSTAYWYAIPAQAAGSD